MMLVKARWNVGLNALQSLSILLMIFGVGATGRFSFNLVVAEDLGTWIMVAVFRQVGTLVFCGEWLKMVVNTAAS